MRIVIIYLIIFIIFLEADEYHLGRGLQVQDTPIYIGGYISFESESNTNNKSLKIDDIAFLSYASYDNLSYMIELEYKDLYSKRFGENSYTLTNTKVNKERVYIQYEINQSNILKIGKFNNEIGFWNMTPINILRATTSNPVLVQNIYPKFVSGINYKLYNFSISDMSIEVSSQNNKSIDEKYNSYIFNIYNSIGLSYSYDKMKFKFNSGYFKVIDELNGRYFNLVAYSYENRYLEILSELATQYTTKEIVTKYAYYLQSKYSFTPWQDIIFRLESIDNISYTKIQNFLISAYTFRPIYPIALKGEYQIYENSDNNKFLFSFSMIF